MPVRYPSPYLRRPPRYVGFGDGPNPLDFVDATQTYVDPYVQPYTGSTTKTASTSGNSGGTDWASFILSAMKLAPNLISAGRGQPYGQSYGPAGSGQSGQQGGGTAGFNLTGSSLLGGGSLGISSSTLMLVAVGFLVVFMMKK